MSLVENLERMLASGRDDAMLRFGLGSALFSEKQFDRAIPHLQACLDHDPEYAAAYKLLAKALLKCGRVDEARTALETGLPVAERKGDKQTEREMRVFLKKITAMPHQPRSRSST